MKNPLRWLLLSPLILGLDIGVQAQSLPSVASGNLQLWLKADAGIINGAGNRVVEWQDQSGGNRHCSQNNTNQQPLWIDSGFNGKPVVRFDGIVSSSLGDFLQGTSDVGIPNAFTSFLVYRWIARSGEVMPVMFGAPFTSIRCHFIKDEQMSLNDWLNRNYGSGFSIPSDTKRIWSTRLNASKTTVNFYDTDGMNDFSSSQGTTSLGTPVPGYYIGGLGSETRNFAGDIAEVIVYQGALTESERLAVENYLREKYWSIAPVIISQPKNQTVIAGSNATFNVALNGGLSPRYQWVFGDSNIINATNAALEILNAQPSDVGNYRVIITNSFGSVTSAIATLNLIVPVVITSPPQDQSVLPGDDVTFTVSATGDSPQYRWSLNSLAIPNATNSSLVLTNVQLDQAGNYKVIVTNALSEASASAELTVNVPPVISSHPQSQTVAAGTTISLNVGVEGAFPLPEVASNLQLWLKADAGIINGSGNRVAQWQDQSGGNRHCSQSSTNQQPLWIDGAFNGKPAVRFDGIVSSSLGDYLQGTSDVGIPNAFTSFLVYRWVARSGEVMPLMFGVPFTSIRSHFIVQEQMSLNDWIYNNHGSGFSIPSNIQRIWSMRLNDSKTTLDFRDTDSVNNFSSTLTTSNLETPLPGYYVGGIGSQTRNFAGDIAEVIVYQGALTDDEYSAVENYLRQKYYQNGTINSLSYQWRFDGTNIVGATNSSLTLSNVQPADTGNYSVVITNLAGSVTSSNALITVHVPPSISSHPESQSGIEGADISFAVTASGSAPLSFEWQFNGVAISNATESTLLLTNIQSSNGGVYSVRVSNLVGTVVSSNAFLTVETTPEILVQPQSQSVIAGADVTFNVGLKTELPILSSGTLRLWLKADAGVITNESGLISQWQDQSGNTNHSFQADIHKQPLLLANGLNGQPAVQFDGIQNANSGDYLQGTGDVGLMAGFTSFLVYSKADRTVDEEVPVLIGAPHQYYSVRAFYIRSISGMNNEMAFSTWGNDYGSGFSIPALTTRIWTERLNPTKTQIEFFDSNGTNSFSTTKGTSFLQTPGSGYFVGGLGTERRNLQGKIAEIIYYQDALNETDRSAVENYLKNKYFGSNPAGGVSSDNLSFQWQFDGTNIVGATNSSLALTNVQTADAGNYSVIVSNSAGFTTSSNAVLTVNIPPSITTQPEDQSVNAGGTASFSVETFGTEPLSYQWQRNSNNLAGATNSTLVLNEVQTSDAGDYRLIVSSPFGTAFSSNATLMVHISTIRVVSANAASASSFELPIELNALGTENAVGFSLSFDPSILTFDSIALDSALSGAALIANTSQIGSGKLGVAVAVSADSAFTAGTQALVYVTFNVGVTATALETSLNFIDSPTTRQISDAAAQTLPSVFIGGTIAVAAVDYEGDVAPRPNGSRTLTITDWVQVGRFVAGLDTPQPGEFRRIDSAPRADLGNGVISITDWVQAGRYAAGIDPLTPVGGPAAPTVARKKSTVAAASEGDRTVILETTNQVGQTHTVSTRLIAQGNENAIGFSLAFDPAVLAFRGATAGGSAAGALLNINTNSLASGRVGVALSLSTGNSFPAGTQEVINLTFDAATNVTTTTVLTFVDAPVLREVSDPAANPLASSFASASLIVNPAPLLTISTAETGALLSWPLSASNFVLEATSAIGTNWTTVTENIETNAQSISTTLPFSDQQQFYRLKQP